MTPAERIAKTVSDATHSRDARAQEWQWRMGASLMFDVGLDHGQADDLSWMVETHHFGCMVAARMDLSPQRILRTGASFAKGSVDHVMVDVIVSGQLSGEAQGRRFEAGAGDLLVLDLAQTSTLTVGASTSLISWVMPRALFEAQRDPAALHGQVVEGRSPSGRMLGTHLRELVATSPELAGPQAAAFGQATASFLTQLLAPRAPGTPTPEGADSLLGRICLYIDRNLGNAELSPASLCRQFGVSRAVLYRLFEPAGGVVAYIRQRRLASARKCLLDPRKRHLRVAQIAHLHCLEPGSFSRMFQRAFGVTPRAVRQGAAGLPADASDGGEAIHLKWFQSL